MLVQVPFNNLPEETRERLALTLQERSRDKTAISDTGRGLFWLGWVLVLGGFIGLCWRVLYGFGVPGETAAIHGPAVAVEFLFYGALVGLPLPWLFVRQIRRRSCPFPPGRYLLAADFVDARDPILQLVPIQEARSIEIARSASIARITLEFDGPSGNVIREVFTVRGQDRIEAAIARFTESQAAHQEAVESGDMQTLWELDPLFSVRKTGWSTLHLGALGENEGTRVSPIPWWTRGMILWFPICICFGSLVLASVRDRLSDALVFELLLTETSTSGWNWYLEQGGARSAEVRAVNLPQAEDDEQERAFSVCLDDGSVACWDSWLEQYGSVSRYQSTAHRVRRELKPRAALDEALAAGSVAALRQYQESATSIEGASYVALANREIADSIAEARTMLLSQIGEDEGLNSSIAGIFGWVESRGEPVVQVRFEAPEESKAAEIDKLVRSSYGEQVPVFDDDGNQVAKVPVASLAPEFQLERVLHREERLLGMLSGGFGSVVPKDILRLELGDPLVPEEELGEVTRPTLVFRTRLEPVRSSRGMIQVLLPPEAYGENPTFEGVYGLPAIQMELEVTIHLPGVEKPYVRVLSVQPPADMRAVHSTLSPEDTNLSQMGGSALVNRAYWLLGTQLRSLFFKDGTDAHAGMRLGEDGAILRAMVVTMLADGVIQKNPEDPDHTNERKQISVMMERISGLVLPEETIEKEIDWVDEQMGSGGWIDRVARGGTLIMQSLNSLPSHARLSIPLAVGWMGQVYQTENDRRQGGLSDGEQLLLSSLLDSMGMSREDYAREWILLFRN